jgi:hypothetical protein
MKAAGREHQRASAHVQGTSSAILARGKHGYNNSDSFDEEATCSAPITRKLFVAVALTTNVCTSDGIERLYTRREFMQDLNSRYISTEHAITSDYLLESRVSTLVADTTKSCLPMRDETTSGIHLVRFFTHLV